MVPTKEQFTRSAAAAGDLIDAVGADQWAAPTPCDPWTVRELVAHMVGGNLVVAARFAGEPVPDLVADHIGAARPGAAFRASAAKLRTALDIPDVLIRDYTARSGPMSGETLMHLRIVDLLVHGWDLAQATGLEVSLPADLAEQELAYVQTELPNIPNGDKFYGQPQPVPDNAPFIDRLVAFTGRTISPA
jgi:uncharacterized protein (TIGR03086 family)